jgi:hypothetical protein
VPVFNRRLRSAGRFLQSPNLFPSAVGSVFDPVARSGMLALRRNAIARGSSAPMPPLPSDCVSSISIQRLLSDSHLHTIGFVRMDFRSHVGGAATCRLKLFP